MTAGHAGAFLVSGILIAVTAVAAAVLLPKTRPHPAGPPDAGENGS